MLVQFSFLHSSHDLESQKLGDNAQNHHTCFSIEIILTKFSYFIICKNVFLPVLQYKVASGCNNLEDTLAEVVADTDSGTDFGTGFGTGFGSDSRN